MTLILQSSDLIVSTSRPSLYESGQSLALRVAAELSGAADGGNVSNLIAGGSAAIGERTFNQRVGSGWSWPKMTRGATPAGGPALRFDGSAQIANYPSTSGFVSRAQPYTLLMVFSEDSYAYANLGRVRILSGSVSSGSGLTFFPTTNVGEFRYNVGSAALNIQTDMGPGEWGAFGMVVNGADSLIITPEGQVTPQTLPAASLNGIRLGGNTEGQPYALGFKGYLAELWVLDRAASQDELTSMHEYLRLKHGLLAPEG